MLRVCLNTQTPPIRPLHPDAPPGSARWKLGVDYEPNVGGVIPMTRALLKTGLGRWIAPDPRWVAMGGPGFPATATIDEGYTFESVAIPEEVRAGYARFKAGVWRSFHGPGAPDRFGPDYRDFVEYNFWTAQHLIRLVDDFDIFWVHDFQQLLVGGLIGTAAPALLRWHIPVDFRGYSEPVRRFFLKAMEGYDAIVVSTRAGLEELIEAGFHGRAFQVYPYIDPSTQRLASPSEIRAFRQKFGLGDAEYVLSVSRMDPVKRQDLLIDAFVRVRRRYPTLRLVLAGGESFSSRSLGAPREAWEERLHRRVREHHLEKAVVFTGSLTDAELQAAYSDANLFVHPAPWEGFGLVAVEAWAHRCPIVVTRGAGVAELVEDDVNGLAVPTGSSPALTQAMLRALAHPEAAVRMGEAGALSARRCHVQRAAPRVREIMERTIALYERAGERSAALGGR
jgi:glycosyltransferase involved in cell wall biosynthesis